MKTPVCVVAAVLLAVSASAFAADTLSEADKVQLKELRVKAYHEPDVVAARKKLDAAYREFWDTVRTAMKRLDLSKAALIDADVESRKKKDSIKPGDRTTPASGDAK